MGRCYLAVRVAKDHVGDGVAGPQRVWFRGFAGGSALGERRSRGVTATLRCCLTTLTEPTVAGRASDLGGPWIAGSNPTRAGRHRNSGGTVADTKTPTASCSKSPAQRAPAVRGELGNEEFERTPKTLSKGDPCGSFFCERPRLDGTTFASNTINTINTKYLCHPWPQCITSTTSSRDWRGSPPQPENTTH